MYSTGQTYPQQGLAATNFAQQNTMQDVAPVPQVLAVQLAALCQLQERLGIAVERGRCLADALFGSQPSPLNSQIEGKGSPIEPPMTVKLAAALERCQSLTEELHVQLNRLERL